MNNLNLDEAIVKSLFVAMTTMVFVLQRDLAFKILRRRHIEIFEKVSIYKKALSLNIFHFLIHSLIV